MLRNQSDRPTTFLPPDSMPTFGSHRRGGVGSGIGFGFLSWMPALTPGRFMWGLMAFKMIAPIATMAGLYLFWPYLLNFAVGQSLGGGPVAEPSSGASMGTMLEWGWGLTKLVVRTAVGG
ncbi:hypothetical protein [Crateriforma conspicua]|uniref:Uncharacterized protein n=1 Tax=Crateriforma conspicua TaxID=2527996 RepID=A0A5C6FFQ9_9PLAN|nr:hypothetical protein [Crateriforma conspicua]TWU59592.1 hypothetical protein V7x_55020 [Crateriforma conspicua]